MREIKFRGWIRAGEWIEPDEVKQAFIMVAAEDLAFEEYAPLCELLRDVEDAAYYTQYTGLKDKTGKEIYEGDVVSMPYSRCTQNWQVLEMSAYGQRFLRLTAKPHPAPHYFRGLHHFDECEVIGNIYENPELVKEVT